MTHHERVVRHDHLVRRVQQYAERSGFTSEVEPNIRNARGLLRKPDLVLRKENRVVIAEVGVSWEGPDPLEAAYRHKVATYSTPEFLAAVGDRYPGAEVAVLPLIMLARGTICKSSLTLAETLQLEERELRELVTLTIKGGLIAHRSFMRLTWRTR